MPSLSVVIITLNEERNIQRCLDSVAGLADEIVVVDSLSTDRTAEICRAAGARVILQEFLGHRQQKAFAIAAATHDVVLSLDADEALSPELRRSVETALRRWPTACYEMNRLNQFMGRWIRHGSWYPERKMRLFDRRKYVMGGVNPHDRFDPAPGEAITFLEGDLLHYANENFEVRVRTMNKYSSIAARAYHERGKRGNWVRVLLKPAGRFLSEFVLKGGFRDGFLGYYIAKTAGHYVWLREVKLLALDRTDQSPF